MGLVIDQPGGIVLPSGGASSVTISQITDAGAVGEDVLAAETQAEAQAAMGVYSEAEVDAAIAAGAGPSRIPTLGALHHWRLDQAGALIDLGSGNVPLTVTGAGWLRQQGGVYTAYDAIRQASPASGDRLAATTSIASGSDLTLAITTAAYAQLPTWVTTSWLLLVWDENPALTGFLAILTTGVGDVYGAANIGGVGVDTAQIAVSWTRPHRLVLTQSGTAIKLYIDGVLAATATLAGTRAAITQVTVGGAVGNPAGVVPSTLLLADAEVFTSAWTAAEVLADYQIARRLMQAI